MISIIIPSLNRHDFLEKLLLALGHQTYTDFEVIIVDQTSYPFNPPSHLSFDVKVLHATNLRSPVLAREYGRKRAKYPLLLFLDDDIRPPFNFLHNLLGLHSAYPSSVICGTSTIRERGSLEMLFRSFTEVGLFHDPRHILFSSQQSPGTIYPTYMISAGIMSLPAHLFEQVSFPLQFTKHILGGDIYFGLTCVQKGISCLICTDLSCEEDLQISFKSYNLFKNIRLSFHSCFILFCLNWSVPVRNRFLSIFDLVLKLFSVMTISFFKLVSIALSFLLK